MQAALNLPAAGFPVMASRPMVYTRQDGVRSAAVVYIGLPFALPPYPDGTPAWGCQVQTIGIGNDRIMTSRGPDTAQAVIYALVLAGTLCNGSVVAAQIDWSAMPNFGFPTVPPGAPDNGGDPFILQLSPIFN